MRRERIAADQPLFAERIAGRATGRRRSRRRAEALAPHLGVDLPAWRLRPDDVLVVVGSKGKGTAATHASATLAAAGLRVGTLTSPGFRSNRERIRVDGTAIARPEYEPLVAGVAARLQSVARDLPDDGYLAPTGLFTLTALLHFQSCGCDVVVVEAGMGGASDEVSLLDPGVVVVGPILAEHIGVLGTTLAEIAVEKLGVIGSATQVVVAVAQEDAEVASAVAAAAGRHRARLEVVAGPGSAPSAAAGLGAANALAGRSAAQALLELRGSTPAGAATLAGVIETISLPGRLSEHRRQGQTWILDAATNPLAISEAVAHITRHLGAPTAVLLFVPHDRSEEPQLRALAGQPVVRVRSGPPSREPGAGAMMHLEEVDFDALGQRVLAVGPVYFIGELLAMLDVDCEHSFELPGPARAEPEPAP